MLKLVNISKTFNISGNKEDDRIALDHVNLEIDDGEFVTVIGGNGSGKTTSLNIIAGSLMPDEGDIQLNYRSIVKLKEYQRAKYFGRVFQDPMMGTASDMSILENLEVALLRGERHSPFKWGFKKAHRQMFIDELKRFDLGLEDRLNQKVGLLSGGQRQALTLLMATIRQKPKLKTIVHDYVYFTMGDRAQAEKEVTEAYNEAKRVYTQKMKELKEDKTLKASERKERKHQIKYEFDNSLNKYDLTKHILLLDEHTAALDPKTASKVLELTERIVNEEKLTTIMITHNMKDALKYGNRLIMYHQGHIVLDVKGEEKAKLTVEDLLKMFDDVSIS